MPVWTRPSDIQARVRRWWDRGEILAAIVTGEPVFPREIRLTGPKARDINEDFGAVMDWVRDMQDASRERAGHGYDLRRENRRSRLHGENRIPVAAVIPDEANALRLIRRGTDAERFRRAVDATRTRLPMLHDWLSRRPLQVLEHIEDWTRILDVVDWFRRHPRPGLYLRQLEIPGVDSKFIEARRGLIAELLDAVLPADAIDTDATGSRGFNRRYGLASEPPLIRFRILDPALALHGLTDLSVPPDQFAAPRPARRARLHHGKPHQWPRLPRMRAQHRHLRPRLRPRPPDRHRLAAPARAPLLGRHRHPRLRHPESTARRLPRGERPAHGSGNAHGPPPALGQRTRRQTLYRRPRTPHRGRIQPVPRSARRSTRRARAPRAGTRGLGVAPRPDSRPWRVVRHVRRPSVIVRFEYFE
ncbi:MAG: DUF3322 domain-containing protein [Anaerolineales bacterium]|nr:DUF3322 domain-containing protein [Anaerolineales bacterium]